MKKYLFGVLAGLLTFGFVFLVDFFLSTSGLHAEATYVDNFLLGSAVGLLVFFLQWRHEIELQRQQQISAVIDAMNHHIRNALQVILYRATIDKHTQQELEELVTAVDRIDRTLSEILPSIRRLQGANFGYAFERDLGFHEPGDSRLDSHHA